MISFDQFRNMMAFDLQNKYCIEIEFSVKGSERFLECGMGKMPDKETGQDIFWFGLGEDGKSGGEYSTFEEFSVAKVFDEKSLVEIWDTVTVLEIDGCDPMERMLDYIEKNEKR